MLTLLFNARDLPDLPDLPGSELLLRGYQLPSVRFFRL